MTGTLRQPPVHVINRFVFEPKLLDAETTKEVEDWLAQHQHKLLASVENMRAWDRRRQKRAAKVARGRWWQRALAFFGFRKAKHD